MMQQPCHIISIIIIIIISSYVITCALPPTQQLTNDAYTALD